MTSVIEYLFGAASFVPHGYCLLWRPDLVAMHAVSDAVIAGSYFSIPAALTLLVRRRYDLAYKWAFWLFVVFILACGATHIIGLFSLWYPIYGLQALVKVATAGASLLTAILLWPLIPKLIRIPSPAALAEANAKLQAAIVEKDQALAQLKSLFDSAPDPTIIVDPRGQILRSNHQMQRLFGYGADTLVGQSVETLLPDRYRQHHAAHRRSFFEAPTARPMGNGMELFVQSQDGREVPTEISLSPIEKDGEIAVIASLRDVSERAEATRQRNAATRNEMLLREMHHRVKNNLQVVSSLLCIRIGSVSDPVALEIINESQRRIQSISFIHQKFYETKEVGVIDFGEYLNDLCAHLSDAFGASASGVRIRLDVQDTPLNLDTAIPFGLIVTELVTNALKHAFPGGGSGNIDIKLYVLDGLKHLEIVDDGVGVPVNVDGGNDGIRGLKLVGFLTQQLGGTLRRMEQERGTAFQVSFGEVANRKRA